ncbi:MAG TPA: tetratricopeptide repeat protein, partial [Terriglobia bacterium]|nr:tetratricopeptide repeat protein [Terriglobia bacterium]
MRAKAIPVLLEIILAALLRADACTAASSDFDEARRQQEAGRYVEAEKLYRAVLKVQPKSVPALTNLGVVLARQGKYGEAVTAYKKVLRLDPDLLPVRM